MCKETRKQRIAREISELKDRIRAMCDDSEITDKSSAMEEFINRLSVHELNLLERAVMTLDEPSDLVLDVFYRKRKGRLWAEVHAMTIITIESWIICDPKPPIKKPKPLPKPK